MTQQEQRIAIAEKCGWRKPNQFPERYFADDAVWSNDWFRNLNSNRLPDYPNDLNAMHEAEKVLTKADKLKYLWHLTQLDNYGRLATASQRAEAFCRTIWPERFTPNL